MDFTYECNDKKYIHISEFIAPCPVLETIYEKEGTGSYLVSVTIPGSGEQIRLLQAFAPDRDELCRQTQTALQEFFDREQARAISGPNGANHLLIRLSAENRLQWQEVLQEPLENRLDVIVRIGRYLTDLQARGIVPAAIDTRTYFTDSTGNLVSWDFCGSVRTGAEDKEALERNRRTVNTDFALLTAQAILGRDVSGENCLLQVAFALQGQMAAEELELLLEELGNGLSGSDLATLQSLAYLASMVLDSRNPQMPALEDPILAASNFLQKNPLWKYVRIDSSGQRRLDILLAGTGPMARAFLDTIIPCAQMLDTTMHIRIVSPDAAAFCDLYLENAPLLAQVLDITHIPSRADRVYTLNGALTGKDRQGSDAPFACVTFENGTFPTAAKLRRMGVGCILLTELLSDESRQALMDFADSIHRPLLIGTAAALPKMAIAHGHIVLSSYAETDLAQSDIARDALAVHTFYSKESNQRISRKEILKNFEDRYNRDSSIRSALSIPYKLCSYGLAGCENVSDRFYDEVLSSEDRVRRLVWLEHRSWQAHLMVNGWTLDTANFKKDFIKNKFNHKSGNWHGCLFGSNDIPDAPLECWSLEDWNSRDLQELDPLDQMSVLRHRILREHVQQHILPRLREYTEHKLYPYLKRKAKPGRNPLVLFQQAENVLAMLSGGVSNARIAWEQLKPMMPQGLCTLADHLIRRNDLRNFKSYDHAIITAIPYLLRRDPIRRVYKLCADHPWQNLASCIFIEPEQWILVTDPAHTVSKTQLGNMLHVLRDRRQIKIEARVLPLTRLASPADEAQWKEALAGTVLDITGASAQQVLEARNHPLLGTLPAIEYRQGKLHDLDTPGCQIRYYNRQQSLTVEETMAITGTRVIAEKADNPMLRMWKYKELWEVVQKTPHYYRICDYLKHKLPESHNIYPSENTLTTQMPWHIAKAFGLIDLLDALVDGKLIQPYTRHDVIQINATELFLPLRSMFRQLEKDVLAAARPEKWNFKVLWKNDHWIVRRNGKDFWHLNAKTVLWHKEIRQENAEGLKKLLLDLKQGKVVESFTWQTRNGQVTIDAAAADRQLQDALNKLLDKYLNTAPADRALLHLRFDSDDPDTICTLESLDLRVCETMASQTDTIRYQEQDRQKRWKDVSCQDLIACLEALKKQGIITTAPNEDVCRTTGNQKKICFEYADPAYRDCLIKTGNALEALVYHTLREMHFFDDVKLGVNILWDRQDVSGKDTTNEIDIICTKGVRSYFISCKNTTELSNDYLTEIRYETDRFGVDGTAILVCTTGTEKALPRLSRAERMGVKIISLQDCIYRADMPQDSAEELKRQLLPIVNAIQ